MAEKLGRSKQDLLAEMADHFYKSKKNPSDLNYEVLKKELSQGINRIISFIKVQEKDTLAPMLAEQKIQQQQLNRLGDEFKEFFELLPEDKMRGKFVSLARELLEASTNSKQALLLVQKNQKVIYDFLKGKQRLQDHYAK
ncbi:BfmA/BtgA family mobilization protein [Dyadobacter flavalbus]|uniref:BfmA/BtgA family mobilization protein n=1 Tax=Dyadobacter flavalbus TaxID=2579942 RepID=UPI00286E01E4|nr:BfmA/BtgA family mobilization protein [Dyadobacter flavalbus]